MNLKRTESIGFNRASGQPLADLVGKGKYYHTKERVSKENYSEILYSLGRRPSEKWATPNEGIAPYRPRGWHRLYPQVVTRGPARAGFDRQNWGHNTNRVVQVSVYGVICGYAS